MEIPEGIRNGIIGDLITREKYKFAQDGIVAEVIRDAFEELKNVKTE